MAIAKMMPQEATAGETRSLAERKRKQGRVRVFGKWCKGCGLCVAFCPQQVFTENASHHPVVAYPDRCVACQWCAIHCPDFAIVVEIVDPAEVQAGK